MGTFGLFVLISSAVYRATVVDWHKDVALKKIKFDTKEGVFGL